MLQDKRYSISDYISSQFYQLPKWIFKGRYKDLSSNERIVYALLRSRFSISVENEWIDDKGCIYFFYKQKELAEAGCLSTRTVQRSIQTLKESGLIDEERVGANRPNRFYLLKPDEEVCSEHNLEKMSGDGMEADEQDSSAEDKEEITDKSIIYPGGQFDVSNKESVDDIPYGGDGCGNLSYAMCQSDVSRVTNCRSPNELELINKNDNINQYQYQILTYDVFRQDLKEKIIFSRFKGKALEETLVNEIIDIIVSNIYLGQERKYNIGSSQNPNYVSSEIIKSVLNNHLDYAVMASYIHQFLHNARSVSHPVNYHIKGLYVQCLSRNSRLISKLKQEVLE